METAVGGDPLDDVGKLPREDPVPTRQHDVREPELGDAAPVPLVPRGLDRVGYRTVVAFEQRDVVSVAPA